MSRRWQIDSLVTSRRLGDELLAYHAGSGDTHLLTPFSEALLDALPAAGTGPSAGLEEVRAHPRVAAFAASEREVADALWQLQEAGIVCAVTDA
ncbi:MAG: HPr-rel-A system PqqD family peptide chaperone [Halofilum sp. (in: g-proteobacteria)]|nr:HPr-rel-A system PqqD family peptide chaperone [Halofilum sp. (in: g-proteobacteria)]